MPLHHRVALLACTIVAVAVAAPACSKKKAPFALVARPTDGGASTASLSLGVLVTDAGFEVRARGSNVAPGCASDGPGTTVPKKGGSYDFDALTSCARVVKKRDPAFANETSVTITATPETPYQVVIATVDALRADEQHAPLFPDVTFGTVRSAPPSGVPIPTSSPTNTPKAGPTAGAIDAPPAVNGTAFAQADPTSDGLVVIVSKTRIVADDVEIVPLDEGRRINAKYKRSGAADPFIVPLATAAVRFRATDREIRAKTGRDASYSESVIVADAETPYRLFTDVLYTLGQSEIAKFHLMIVRK